jgi:outer membrane protein TolC
LSLAGSSSSFAANPLQGANYGFTSDKLHKLFKNKSRIWGIGGLLTVPVFDFGNRLAGVEAQRAVQRQAALFYQKSVVSALEEVESALTAAFNEEDRERSLEITAAANRKNYDLTLGLFKAGLADALQVSAAQKVWLSAASDLTDSQESLTTDVISLYKSIGGSW